MNHAYPSGVYQQHRDGTVLECSKGEFIVMHHDDKGYNALKQCAALKGIEWLVATHTAKGPAGRARIPI